MTTLFAIDPGMTGAIACIRDGVASVEDLPVITDRALAWVDGNALTAKLLRLRSGKPATCIIERVGAMPGQGVSSSFKFGMGFGSILGVLQSMQIPIEFVTPVVWKRDLGLAKEKTASLDKARLLFPYVDLHLQKHDGRAEALLIAHWYMTKAQAKAAA
ncbi:MAG TPA: hypothetical protein VGN16_07815 [Acidobacteriaceae bacterium]|jgi:crossover junction endodeoxyribonuclease RuvC